MKIAEVKNEIINSTYSISAKVDREFRIHCHESFEILLFIAGDIHYMIEGDDYYPAKNSLLLMPPGVVHGIEENLKDGYERYVAHIKSIDPEINTLLEKVYSKDRYYVLSDSAGIREAFEDMYKANSLSKELFLPALYSLLLKIILMQEDTKAAKPTVTAGKTVSEIINYINESYDQKQTLDEIASRFFLSKHHLNEIFRKATGVTVWEYIIRKRIYKARTLMREGLSATEAAYKSGFSDYSAFYKAYVKRIGKSPKSK